MREIIKTISIPVEGKPLDFRLTKLDAFSGVALLRMLSKAEQGVQATVRPAFGSGPSRSADAELDGWFETGEPQESKSARKHSLSDGFAFVGWRTGSGE